jgi:Kef-type K+ transport system membrane component KefB
VLCLPLGAMDVILSPLMVCIALAATSVGIVIPVLRDTGTLDTKAGRFTVAGGSIAEFGTIAMLAIFFSADASPTVEAVLVVVICVLAVGVLWGLARFVNHPRAREINLKLDDTSSQVRVRLAVLLLLAAAVVAGSFGFEIILGTFLAGAVLAVVVKTANWHDEAGYRRKLEAVGFGFFVPIFFVNSGLNFHLDGLFTAPELMRIAMFVAFLLLIHMIPVLLYRKHLRGREVRAAGLLQATNLSFIVVVVNLGLSSGEMKPITGSSLIMAGLISALMFPALAQKLLATEGREPDVTPAATSDEAL